MSTKYHNEFPERVSVIIMTESRRESFKDVLSQLLFNLATVLLPITLGILFITFSHNSRVNKQMELVLLERSKKKRLDRGDRTRAVIVFILWQLN